MDSDSTEKGAVFKTPATPDKAADVDISRSTPVLEKRFNLLSACATGITTGNTWTALGGAIVRSVALLLQPPKLTLPDCLTLQWRASWNYI
jgi:hypothetical protein